MPARLSQRIRERYRVAIAIELERFEQVVLRMWQIISVAGIGAGVVYALTISVALGLGSALTAAVFLLWFVLLGYLHGRGALSPAWIVVNTMAEAQVPWIFMTVIALTKGAGYALATWVTPFLYCTGIVSYVVRLAPARSVLFGLVAGVTYPILYISLLRPRLPPGALETLVAQPGTQVARSLTLVGAGVIAGLLIVGLRHLLGTAQSAVREAELFGKYQLGPELGPTPLGTRFAGHQRRGHAPARPVVIERVRPDLVARAGVLEELSQRARTVATLAHPNIVQLLDFGLAGDGHFVVTEQLSATTLAGLEPAAPLSPEAVAQIGLGTLAALEHLHTGALSEDGRPLRIVHGDLGPDSVLVTLHGEVKLGDLLLPAALRPAPGADARPALAPELARGDPPSEASDLYALGVMLWELLAAERRVPGQPALPLGRRRSDLDAGWDAFFLRVLAPEPASRFASAREMSRALEALIAPDAPRREALASTVAAVGVR